MIPVPAFLIRHPSAGAILVDTGLHPSIATDGKENFGGLGNRVGKPTLEAGEDVPGQLRKRGLDPGEIPIVVMTHLHTDHTSAISEFSKSTFVVSETEWEAAATGSQPTPQRLPPPALRLRLRLPHASTSTAPASTPTPASAAPSTSSATARSTSPSPPATAPATCRWSAASSSDDFVIGGDAMYMAAQLDGDVAMPPRPFDAHNFRRSLQELRLFHESVPRGDDHAGARSGLLRPSSRSLRVARSRSYISRTCGEDLASAASSWRSRLGSARPGSSSARRTGP